MASALLHFAVLFLFAAAAWAQHPSTNPMADIAASHIKANVPPPAQFAKLLIRDLFRLICPAPRRAKILPPLRR
jgi:hypothetical protein